MWKLSEHSHCNDFCVDVDIRSGESPCSPHLHLFSCKGNVQQRRPKISQPNRGQLLWGRRGLHRCCGNQPNLPRPQWLSCTEERCRGFGSDPSGFSLLMLGSGKTVSPCHYLELNLCFLSWDHPAVRPPVLLCAVSGGVPQGSVRGSVLNISSSGCCWCSDLLRRVLGLVCCFLWVGHPSFRLQISCLDLRFYTSVQVFRSSSSAHLLSHQLTSSMKYTLQKSGFS